MSATDDNPDVSSENEQSVDLLLGSSNENTALGVAKEHYTLTMSHNSQHAIFN